MGEKSCAGRLDWGFVCGYIIVNTQRAQWDYRCIPTNAVSSHRETSAIVGASLAGLVNAQGAQWG